MHHQIKVVGGFNLYNKMFMFQIFIFMIQYICLSSHYYYFALYIFRLLSFLNLVWIIYNNIEDIIIWNSNSFHFENKKQKQTNKKWEKDRLAEFEMGTKADHTCVEAKRASYYMFISFRKRQSHVIFTNSSSSSFPFNFLVDA